MSRKTIYVLKDTNGSESVKTSVHGSQYNADAASPEMYRMGPSHKTLKAVRLIEATCRTRKVALLPIVEANEKGAPAIVSSARKKSNPTFSELLKSIENDRRQAQRQLQYLKDTIQRWMNDGEAVSQEGRAERYQNAVKFQEELRKSMHTTRKLRNECKTLTYTDELDTIKSHTRRPEVEDIEIRLENMAATIEKLQDVVDMERKGILKLVEESGVKGARRRKAAG